MSRNDVAGRDVTRQLQLLLRRAGLTFTTSAEADLAKTIKEDTCFLTPTVDILSDKNKAPVLEKESRTQYRLPDGQVVLMSSERYMAPNVLFDPSMLGSEEPGAAEILVNSIMKSDMDLRPKFFSQIVISGGSTMTPGFGDRLLNEVRSKAPAHTNIRISAPPERLYSCYVGGSILASLATFKSMWVSKAEYEEIGSNALHRREL